MNEASRYEPALWRVLWELRPYLDDVVVIGGWVPYLYSRYGGFAEWRGRTSLTTEVDVLVDRPLPPGERESISEILQRGGFQRTEGSHGAAVWVGDLEAGEKIEFLVPHAGTARQIGDAVPVPAQTDMRAISLPGLEVMRRFKRRLSIPVPAQSGAAALEVWVPWLGAYVVNKGATFTHRMPDSATGESKRPKDLLYLRDVSAAGPEVAEQVAGDIREMVRDRRIADQVRYAANNLRLVVKGSYDPDVLQAVAAMREREPVPSDAIAAAELRGYLADLLEILVDP
jgi:hypothetical protein